MRYILLLFVLVFSCSSKKDVLILQNNELVKNFDISYKQITIKPDDILRIKLSASSPEISQLFTFEDNLTSSSLETFQINGFLVDKNGFISVPILGDIMVNNLTTREVSTLIQKSLVKQGLLLNASVDVKILNSYFTIIGEVNKPGRYNFLKNNMDLLEAIGIAGDLTINGERRDIKLVRENNGNLTVSKIDITTLDFINSDSFQVLPGDVIIVNPNNARIKNAGIISDSRNFISFISLILTSIVLITTSN